ncbi:glycosyl transferase [Sulfurimonas hongkongensis]|uniref:Glycosyl transferase n=1 Tax=Sulfurimonas hongkongensis TaxID=1172190 RepID=T0JC34_9BACT|nr:glycosyltransferase family 4 protein [Sulfurimonas hongkongensis]EQB35626.1 glycosyl transferase [Sulfurimonas hongkongensis]
MRKILELCLSPDIGGLELYMVRASHYLHESEMDVVSVINESGKLEQYYKDTQHKYEKIKRSSTLLTFFTAKKLAKIIDDNYITIVHLHWTKDIPVAVLAKLISKQNPKLIQTRNMTMTRFKDDFYHRFLYKNIDLMLAVTSQVKEQIEKFVPIDVRPKVEVLYMGAKKPSIISDEEIESICDKYSLKKSFIVGIVGRIEERKGQYLVIDAIKKLTGKNIDAKALIIGHTMSDGYLSSLKSGIEKDAIKDKIVFTGFTREVQKLMQACDVIVLATDRETFGLVLIEAMQCEIAVVASDSGGPLEIIDNNKSGLLFKTNDSHDLAKKLELLYSDKALRDSLAKAGAKKASILFDAYKQFQELKNVLVRI